MIQYTTPTISVTMKGVALGQSDIAVMDLQPVHKDTKKPIGNKLTFTNPNIEVTEVGTVVSVVLTQVQSASLPTGEDDKACIKTMVNYKTADGKRGATRKFYFVVESNVHDEVM